MSLRLMVDAAHPTLRHAEREGLGEDLQEAIVELVDLAMLANQARWNGSGPAFATLRAQLDELLDTCRALADGVAERAVALGVSPDIRSTTVAHRTHVEPLVAGPLSDREIISGFGSRLAEAIARMRTHMAHVAEHDRVSEAVLIEVVAALERHRWMLHRAG